MAFTDVVRSLEVPPMVHESFNCNGTTLFNNVRRRVFLGSGTR